ncbi:trehalose operon repressor [Paludifilum halophilum]|uniref:Trehalose operon repressor n=1 Tax=Paludifilum halophilum TaxID=1642702 RepID=A0A235B469_9BACL|nr:trehalose operon repressor [Paludifilum halophilum]OYD07098.1 trehalose operon repressor [Paludifilum halophilum]
MENIYWTIYRDYADQIEQGRLSPDSKLPSENQLAKRYGTSRETVRKALHLLSQNGYIHKIKGKGSFVLHVNKFDFPVSGLVSFKEVATKSGKEWNTDVVSLETGKPDPYVASQLNIQGSEAIWKVVRVREVGGEKIILDKDHFHKGLIPPLTKDICRESIYEYLERSSEVKISFAKKVITIEGATEEDERLLDLDRYAMMAVVRNYVYLDDSTLFQYTESRHRPDKFRFVDFARRY